MQKAAASDKKLAARVNHFNHRELEEFYDYKVDPFALDNKIDDLDYLPVINQLRCELAKSMKASGDAAWEVFMHRNSASKRKEFMKQQEEYSNAMNHSGLGRKRKL